MKYKLWWIWLQPRLNEIHLLVVMTKWKLSKSYTDHKMVEASASNWNSNSKGMMKNTYWPPVHCREWLLDPQMGKWNPAFPDCILRAGHHAGYVPNMYLSPGASPGKRYSGEVNMLPGPIFPQEMKKKLQWIVQPT